MSGRVSSNDFLSQISLSRRNDKLNLSACQDSLRINFKFEFGMKKAPAEIRQELENFLKLNGLHHAAHTAAHAAGHRR
ncbi:MAG: hypothetical protein IJT47_01760, partial [Selenomonadaceae bacterium]|nr:hypothetical protein [Selenomonadaceae bacterium]